MLEPGTQLGRYEIQRRLGRGGMGTVYVAHDPILGRMVAVKVFAGELDFPDARERFSREARSAAALSHPNIVTVYDFGEFDSQPFIVMEYVPGETLAAVIRRKAEVRTADKLRWIDELCAGAGYAHEKSVIHRDIKPANLMIDRGGRLKILDFGIARVMGAASNTTAMIGTPGYMAPEQIEGKAADHRADLFSIGVVFYELLAYTEAFPGDTIPAITHRILSDDPVPLTHLIADVDPDVVAIVERALQKDAADRFEDAESMRAALARLRRQFEVDVTSIRPADARRRDVSPPGPSRGTGSARSPLSGDLGVASLTPPPDRISADPDALARLRVAYMDAALESAQTLFDQGQLSASLAACHQALAYDATNTRALELEAQIESAMLAPADVEDHGSAASYLDAPPTPSAADAPDRRAATAGGSPTASARLTDPAAARGTPTDRTVLRPMRRTPPPIEPTLLRPSEPPIEPTLLRPGEPAIVPPSEATIVAPSRRTPAPQPAARTELPPLPKAPKAPKPGAADRRAKLPAVDVQAKLRALSGALRAIDFRQLGTRRTLIWGGAGILALALLTAGIISIAGGPAPTGTLVVDAVPWATVSAVVTEAGEPQTLPSPASTPLALTLPAGNYEVVLVGPPPDSQEQRVSVRVEAQTAVAVPAVRFRPVTPEEYFEQYLAAPVETPPSPAPDSPAPTVSTPATGVSQ